MKKPVKPTIQTHPAGSASLGLKTWPVIWLTGNSGAGKSTAAFAVARQLNSQTSGVTGAAAAQGKIIVLDGDEMRQSISREEGFSAEDRRRHNLRVVRLARLLQTQGFLVLVSVIAPFHALREEIETMIDVQWVYVRRSGLEAPDRPYEAPIRPALVIDNDHVTPEQAQEALRDFIRTTVSSQVHDRAAA